MSDSNKKVNTLAIVAVTLVWFIPLPGLILGIIANGQIKETGEDGHTQALVAIIAGSIIIAIFIITMIVALEFIAPYGSTAGRASFTGLNV